MAQKYKNDALAALHESMQGLHDIGLVDAKTMRQFDSACLTPIEDMTAEESVDI